MKARYPKRLRVNHAPLLDACVQYLTLYIASRVVAMPHHLYSRLKISRRINHQNRHPTKIFRSYEGNTIYGRTDWVLLLTLGGHGHYPKLESVYNVVAASYTSRRDVNAHTLVGT